MHAQQQRAEAGARALRVGIATDHELLPLPALELDPVGRPAGPVGRRHALADHALEAEPASRGDQLAGRCLERVAEAHRIAAGLGHERAQRLPALCQRQAPQVMAVEEGQIEDIEDQAAAVHRAVVRAARRAASGPAPALEGVLQRLEIRNAVPVGHHDFAIDPAGLHRQGTHGARQAGHAVGPVVAVAGDEAHLAAFDPGEDAVAVELELEHPFGQVGGRAVHQGGQLRRQRRGQGRLLRARGRSGPSSPACRRLRGRRGGRGRSLAAGGRPAGGG